MADSKTQSVTEPLSPSPLRGGSGRGVRIKNKSSRHDNPWLQPLARSLRQRQTPAEKKLWIALREANFGVKFRRQQPIDTYIVDFCCLSLNLIIEIDGDSHDVLASADRVRDGHLVACGYSILRFSNAQILRDIEVVMDNIQQQILILSPLAFNPLPNPPRKGEGKLIRFY